MISSIPDHQKSNIANRLFEDLVSDICLKIVFDQHRQFKLSKSHCQICLTNCRSFSIFNSHHSTNSNSNSNSDKSGHHQDIFGNHSKESSEKFECPNCKSCFPNTRYAPHLEKCLGLGRNSRLAFRRGQSLIRQSSPSASVESEEEFEISNINNSTGGANSSSMTTTGKKERKRKGSPTKKSKKMKESKDSNTNSSLTNNGDADSAPVPKIKLKPPKINADQTMDVSDIMNSPMTATTQRSNSVASIKSKDSPFESPEQLQTSKPNKSQSQQKKSMKKEGKNSGKDQNYINTNDDGGVVVEGDGDDVLIEKEDGILGNRFEKLN